MSDLMHSHEHIQQAYTELLKRLSATSVHRVHRGLKTALRHAVKIGLIAYNPIDRVIRPGHHARRCAH
jgi:hypothetical protein